MLGCVGIYFWLVMFFFQQQKNPFMIYELEGIEDMQTGVDRIDTFKWAFLITSFVSSL
jgi:hypothetical protein